MPVSGSTPLFIMPHPHDIWLDVETHAILPLTSLYVDLAGSVAISTAPGMAWQEITPPGCPPLRVGVRKMFSTPYWDDWFAWDDVRRTYTRIN